MRHQGIDTQRKAHDRLLARNQSDDTQHQLQKKEKEIMDVCFRHERIKVSSWLHTDQSEMEKQFQKL